MKPIAHIRSPFMEKFGTPRQPGINREAAGVIEFEPEFRDPNAIRGLENCSHLWLIFLFDRNPSDKPWSPTVRPPRLGGNERIGVFASRSPFRPNPIGLSVVKLESIEPNSDLHVSGIDLVDGTPILDIKPYIAYGDSIPDASYPAFDRPPSRLDLPIRYATSELERDIAHIHAELAPLLEATLRQDPRPAFQDDPKRSYTFQLTNCEVTFRITADEIIVEAIDTSRS